MSEERKEILLESGTNELEVVTYTIGTSTFSINVMKVREIIHPTPVTEVPESHPAVEGVLQVRGEIIPVIDLAKALNLTSDKSKEETKFIIAELNKMKVVFRVEEVHRIQRISWSQIEEPSTLAMGLEETTSGIIKMNERIVLMLDYEKLVHDISPGSNMSVKDVEAMGEIIPERAEKPIYVVEDSAMLRQLLEETLRAAGYTNLQFFKNGQDALEQVETVAKDKGKSVTDVISGIITDIEMPKMDGHHFTKRVKEHESAKNIPVVIFSALISEELRHKGEKVGADAQVSKPEIAHLIRIVDSLVL